MSDGDKNPWELYPDIWPTKAFFFSWLRGSLRRAIWNTYPIKIAVLRESNVPIPIGYEGRTKKFSKCSLTGEIVATRNCQVDHKTGGKSLQEWDDVLPFIRHLCAPKDELQVVSKEAHNVKSYAEREHISFEKALAIKQAIAIVKAKKDKEWLSSRGVEPAGNAAKRRQQIIEILGA
jgi:hypothetical protein